MNNNSIAQQYVGARNKVTAMLRKAKHNFILNLKHANCREVWKAMRYVNKKQTGVPSLSVGTGNFVTDAREKAHALNSFL